MQQMKALQCVFDAVCRCHNWAWAVVILKAEKVVRLFVLRSEQAQPFHLLHGKILFARVQNCATCKLPQ